MPQFVQGRGLDGTGALAWADLNQHLRFQLPLLLALHHRQAQLGPAVAGPTPAQGRPSSQDAYLGPLRLIHPLQGHQLAPAGQGSFHRHLPGFVPAGGRPLAAHRLQPDAPVVAPGPAVGRGAQLMAVVVLRSGAKISGAGLNRQVGRLGEKQLLACGCRTAVAGGGDGFHPDGAAQQEWQHRQKQGGHQPARDPGSPTPRAIRVASRGIRAKPVSSIFRIQASRWARASLTWGSSPLRRGIAQRM